MTTTITKLVFACSLALAPSLAATQSIPLLERIDWRLQQGELEPVVVTFKSGTVSFRGCNQHSGPYQLNGNVLVVTQIASTEMACTGAKGKVLMDTDAFLSKTLTSSPRFSIEGNTLWLKTGGLEVELEGLSRK